MKILFVNTYHYRRGGAEVHALDLAEDLRRRGHDVRFFSMHHPDNLPSPDSMYWVPEIDYRSMNASRTPLNAARVLMRAIYSFSVRRALARMLGDWHPDVAHLHNIHVHLTPSVVDEFRAQRVPTVWTLHDYKLICPNQAFVSDGEVCERCKGQRFWECTVHKCKRSSLSASLVATIEAEVHRFLRLPERVDAFIAPSDFLKRKFVEFGWPAEKFIHMPNFTNVSLAAAPHMPDGRRVLFSGHLTRTKGVLSLIEAVREMPNVQLDLAGDGPVRGDVESMIAARDWRGADVRVHGHVSKDVLEGLIDDSRVIVAASEWYENSPYSVIEAFAHAKPVVASRIGGLPELVLDGINGITVNPGAPSEISEAVGRLMHDPELWSTLAQGALDTAAVRDVEVYVDRLERLYRDVAAPEGA